MSDASLDILSISQTLGSGATDFDLCLSRFCDYGAPQFAIPVNDGFRIIQANCHHWDCKRCGVLIARQNYGRIVERARGFSGVSDLWMLTLTCRGGGLSVREAEENYLTWSNRLLTAMRTKAKRAGILWAYACVTERQKRGHPHSHYLMTWHPADTITEPRYHYETIDGRRKRVYEDAYRSKWLSAAIVGAGFGPEYWLDKVRDPEKAARYVAKYMFKDTSLERWPPKWRRVRYSQNWKALDKKEPGAAIALLGLTDWHELFQSGKHISVSGKDQTLLRAANKAQQYARERGTNAKYTITGETAQVRCHETL